MVAGATDAELTVVLTNTTLETASMVRIDVQQKSGSDELIIFKRPRFVESLAAGETRTLQFTLLPNPNEELLTGTYLIIVSGEINGELFEVETSLEVIAAQ